MDDTKIEAITEWIFTFIDMSTEEKYYEIKRIAEQRKYKLNSDIITVFYAVNKRKMVDDLDFEKFLFIIWEVDDFLPYDSNVPKPLLPPFAEVEEFRIEIKRIKDNEGK